MTGVAASGAVRPRMLIGARSRQSSRSKAWRNRRGAAGVVLNDLSPAATFIAANYNLPFDVKAFADAGKCILKEVEEEVGWMYETRHTDGTNGQIEYTVWSEVFTCPDCAGEVVFLDEALDEETKRVRDAFPCPHCGAIYKRQLAADF